MDEITIRCPTCEAEFPVPANVDFWRCEHCGQGIDILAHIAYEWGQEVFLEAREVAIARRIIPFGKRSRWHPLEEDVALPYEQAYSAIREAFRTRLPEKQRKAGIEIMAEITGLFAYHLMTSPIEANYWGKLLAEQKGLDQILSYRERLSASPKGFRYGLLRLWWRFRVNRLRRYLAKLSRQIDQLEALLDPVEPLQARLPKAQRV